MIDHTRQRGYINYSIVLPIIVILGIVAYTAYNNVDITEIPLWLWFVAGMAVFVFLLLPKESAFSRNLGSPPKSTTDSRNTEEDKSSDIP
jgi:beta-lactamase regulating signal transducer with metallopeptidase domain